VPFQNLSGPKKEMFIRLKPLPVACGFLRVLPNQGPALPGLYPFLAFYGIPFYPFYPFLTNITRRPLDLILLSG
jgi:hypothetical protein